jgi:hypothetical protein
MDKQQQLRKSRSQDQRALINYVDIFALRKIDAVMKTTCFDYLIDK